MLRGLDKNFPPFASKMYFHHSENLANKPSGCVIWIRVTDHLDMGPFFWFGASPGEPLPVIDMCEIPLRATHNKIGERPPRRNHRLVPGVRFEELKTMQEILTKLFG